MYYIYIYTYIYIYIYLHTFTGSPNYGSTLYRGRSNLYFASPALYAYTVSFQNFMLVFAA